MICLFLLAGIFRGCQSNSDFFKSKKVAGKKLNILDLKQTTTAIKMLLWDFFVSKNQTNLRFEVGIEIFLKEMGSLANVKLTTI